MVLFSSFHQSGNFIHRTTLLTKLNQACSLQFQLSWIQQILSNPDVFCFADYPCHTVVIDLLKTAPEDDNREIATW